MSDYSLCRACRAMVHHDDMDQHEQICPGSSDDRFATLDERVETLEAQVHELIDRVNFLEKPPR